MHLNACMHACAFGLSCFDATGRSCVRMCVCMGVCAEVLSVYGRMGVDGCMGVDVYQSCGK